MCASSVALDKFPVKAATDTITSHGHKVVFSMFLIVAWVTVAVFFTYLTSVLPEQIRDAFESWQSGGGGENPLFESWQPGGGDDPSPMT